MAEKNNDGDQYHLEVSQKGVAETVLLPGDPDRVEKITELWDKHEQIADHREYRTATGSYEGTEISVTSTGIGSPSAAIAVEELASVGAKNLIRVGSCGAIQPEVSVGDIVISDSAVRLEGTTGSYVREEHPAVADYEVVTALVTAAERLGYDYHVGKTATTDSFYVGQSREGFEGFLPERSEKNIEVLREEGVLNFEMEASSIMILAGLYGLRAGAVCTVYADRTGEEFNVEGERKAAETATLASKIISDMEKQKSDSESGYWNADLSI
jgi:uridine phosphorylase